MNEQILEALYLKLLMVSFFILFLGVLLHPFLFISFELTPCCQGDDFFITGFSLPFRIN